MADPKSKYAGLPGIASPDEKDCYETDDLPEADQESLLEEAESEFIVRPHLNARTAHDKFRGKKLIPSKDLDFSDAARRRPNIGYLAVSGNWEIAAEGEEETLQQRRHRLEAEFRLLIEDLNKLKESEKAAEEDVNMAVTIVPELESTLQQLTQLQVADAEGDFTANPSQHIQNIQRLIQELNDSERKKVSAGEKPSEVVVTYHLNSFPAHAQFAKSSRLADLELRLKQLEDVLGTTPENLNRLQLSELKSVSEGVRELSARTNLLDLNTIDAIDAKLGSLLSKMDAVSEKRGGPQLVEMETKVNEIFESYKKVEALTQSLLPIADRLAALSSLNQEAGEFKKTISQLKAELGKMTNKIAADETAAQNIRDGMKDLLQTVSSNIANFNTRLVALQK